MSRKPRHELTPHFDPKNSPHLNQRELFLRYQAQTSPFPLALEIERAEGIYLYGKGEKRWMDLISGIAVSGLGHGHPAIVKAVQEQASRHLHTMVYGELIQSPQLALAEKLISLLPETLNNVFFVNSGSEAVEGAMKLAKRATGRRELVAFAKAYHGSTQGALSIGGSEEFKSAFRPLLPDVRQLDYGQLDQLQQISCRTAAVVAEVVQAEAGVVLPPPGYLSALRKRCSDVGALLIFDESQTGCGRSGRFLGLEHSGVIPDILVLAKALGGGLPLGAFIASRELMQELTHQPVLGHISTFGGHPLSCAAALAALEVLQVEGLMSHVPGAEAQFHRLLLHPAIRELRSFGLLMALELESSTLNQALIAHALERGVLSDWFLYADHCLRIAPPLIIGQDQIEQACEILLEALEASCKAERGLL